MVYPTNPVNSNNSRINVFQAVSDYMSGKITVASPLLGISTSFPPDVANLSSATRNVIGNNTNSSSDNWVARNGVMLRRPKPVQATAKTSDTEWIKPESVSAYTERFEQAFFNKISDGRHVNIDSVVSLFGTTNPNYNVSQGAFNDGMRASVSAIFSEAADSIGVAVQQIMAKEIAKKANICIIPTDITKFYQNNTFSGASRSAIAMLVDYNNGIVQQDYEKYAVVAPPFVTALLDRDAQAWTQASVTNTPYKGGGKDSFLSPVYSFQGMNYFSDTLMLDHISGNASSLTDIVIKTTPSNLATTLTLNSPSTDSFNFNEGDIIVVTGKKYLKRLENPTVDIRNKVGYSTAPLTLIVQEAASSSAKEVTVKISPMLIDGENVKLSDLNAGTGVMVVPSHRKAFVIDRQYLKSVFVAPAPLANNEGLQINYTFDRFNPNNTGSMRQFFFDHVDLQMGSYSMIYTYFMAHAFENMHAQIILPTEEPDASAYIPHRITKAVS